VIFDMTLTQNGKNYICQNFGSPQGCVVSAGLWWSWEDIDGNTGTEAGCTGACVGTLILSQLITKITMLTPDRGDFFYSDLRAANGDNDITFNDVDEIILHDENSSDQWCYIPSIVCEEIPDKTACLANNCFWYKNWFWEKESCHTKKFDPMMQYLVYGGIGAAGLGVIVLLAKKRR